jgi:hypothetical protein
MDRSALMQGYMTEARHGCVTAGDAELSPVRAGPVSVTHLKRSGPSEQSRFAGGGGVT